MHRSDSAGETRMALLEMRTVPQRQCETILLLKRVSLKMSERELSYSEFYYRGELSDAEMLQLPTQSKATQRKSLLSNQEIKKCITSQQQANTGKKITYDTNAFQRSLNECGQKTKGHGNPPGRPGQAVV